MKIVIVKSLNGVKGECDFIPKAKIQEEEAQLLAYPATMQGEVFYLLPLSSLKLLKERSEVLGLTEMTMRLNVLLRDPIPKNTCLCDVTTTIDFKGVKLHEDIPLTDAEIFFYGPEAAREKKKGEILTSIRYLKNVLKLNEWEHLAIIGNDVQIVDCNKVEFPPLTIFQLYVADNFQLADVNFKLVFQTT